MPKGIKGFQKGHKGFVSKEAYKKRSEKTKLPTEIRKCKNLNCSKTFECKIIDTQRYCSRSCVFICKRFPVKIKRCQNVQCNKEFECRVDSDQKYCSKKCRGICKRGVPTSLRQPRENRKCKNKNCSEEFECIITSSQEYCSHNCYSVCKEGIPSPNKLPREIRQCANPNCEKEFECRITDTNKYCCHRCYGICKKGEPSYKKLPTETRKCRNATCNNKFESRIDINQEYCSKECYWIDPDRDREQSEETVKKRADKVRGQRRVQEGDITLSTLNSYIRNLSEYYQWRDDCLKRDDYKCQECSLRFNLEIHHSPTPFFTLLLDFLRHYSQFSLIEDIETLVRLAITWEPFWNLDNGKTLCQKHHSEKYRETWKLIKQYKDNLKEK